MRVPGVISLLRQAPDDGARGRLLSSPPGAGCWL